MNVSLNLGRLVHGSCYFPALLYTRNKIFLLVVPMRWSGNSIILYRPRGGSMVYVNNSFFTFPLGINDADAKVEFPKSDRDLQPSILTHVFV